MSENSIWDLPTVSWDTPATATTIADIRAVTVRGKEFSRYAGIEVPEILVGEPMHFFTEDSDGLYMRLEDVVRLLKRHATTDSHR